LTFQNFWSSSTTNILIILNPKPYTTLDLFQSSTVRLQSIDFFLFFFSGALIRRLTHWAMVCICSTLSTNTLRFQLSSFPNTNFHLPSTNIFSRPLAFKGLSVNPKGFLVPLKASMADTNKVAVEVFESEDLAVSLATYVADLSNKFTSERGAFTVCLSGGSLIKYLGWGLFFVEKCSYYEPKHDSIELNWINVNVFCFGFSGNCWNRPMLILLNGPNGKCFGWMRGSCLRLMMIVTTSSL